MAVFAFGSNAISQLGLGQNACSTHTPVKLEFFNEKAASKVKCGTFHTLMLTSDGILYSWGCNDEGALGRDGDETIPEKVLLEESVIDMGCGASISAAVTCNGHVYIWGTFRTMDDVFGLTPKHRISFFPVKTQLKNIKSIAVGQGFVVALDSDGTIFTFGANDFFELGRRTSKRNKTGALTPRAIISQSRRPEDHGFKYIKCGLCHTIAVNIIGETYCWGSNTFGQLGHRKQRGTYERMKVPLEGVVQAEGGGEHSFFITGNGTLYACGKNSEFQLGLISIKYTDVPTELKLENVKTVRSYDHFSICQIDNSLYSWGVGFCGALGFEDEEIPTPKRIPFEFPEIVDFDTGNDFSVVVTK